MSEKTVMIVNAVVNSAEKEALAYYQENATPLFIKAGGKPLGKFKITERLSGNQDLHMAVVMEFDSGDSIKEVFNSEVYKELLPYREKAFSEINIFIGVQ